MGFQRRSKPPKSKAPSLGRTSLVAGRLVCHRDGFGFVIPDQRLAGMQGDIFIGSRAMGSAMHGDRVAVSSIRMDSSGRAEGRIHRVLERAQTTVVGRLHFGRYATTVIPYDDRILQPIHIPKGQEFPAGATALRKEDLEDAVVHVEITRFPTATEQPAGKVVEILGREGEFGIDVEIVIRKHHLPHQFPPEVLQEAARVPSTAPEQEILRRRDFRSLPIVTIDGETAKDFDDAVAVLPLANGHFQLQVHIADVACYVAPQSPLDREARLRGTSVYFPDRAVPMLPHELSSGICSLKPGEDRLVLSALMEMDPQGEMVDATLCAGVIRSAARMTYTEVNQILENDAPTRQRYAHLVTHFERMRDLAVLLNRKRRQRGAIDFDLPEPFIEFDESGLMVSIVRMERNIAHRLIEEFMLAANEAVAAYLEGTGVASLYRIHEKPDPAKVMEFEDLAATFGYSLGIGPLPVRRFTLEKGRGQRGKDRKRGRTLELPVGDLKISPRHYQRLTDKIAGKPEERILSYLMLRSLKQACYREENVGHFALAADSYTHFTSPIRRYPDLVVHRILRALLAASPPDVAQLSLSHPSLDLSLPDPIARTELQETALESSEAERRAAEAERELMEWKKARFMRDRLGEEFDALIISVTKFGFFVELLEYFIEGLVPIETLTDDRYKFQEQQRQWLGERTRRRFRIGDRLRVRLDRVGEPGGKMNFSPAEVAPHLSQKGRRTTRPSDDLR